MDKKKIYLGIIIFSIILIITGIILAFNEKDYNQTNENQNAPQQQTYKINEDVTIGYIKITLISSKEYKDYDKCSYDFNDNTLDFSTTSLDDDCIDMLDNQKIQEVTFQLKGLKNNQLVNTTNFKCIADNVEYNQIYRLGKKEFSNVLMVGDTITGSIYCQIPKDAKKVKVEYINDNKSGIFFEI